jgi:hypothetical protein
MHYVNRNGNVCHHNIIFIRILVVNLIIFSLPMNIEHEIIEFGRIWKEIVAA